MKPIHLTLLNLLNLSSLTSAELCRDPTADCAWKKPYYYAASNKQSPTHLDYSTNFAM